jgi:hypothetical protein
VRRRAFLGSVAGAAAGAGAHPNGTGSGDTETTADGFAPAGRVAVPGTKEVVVDEDGTAYLAVTDGVATVDVTDPAEPALLAERRDLFGEADGGPLELVQDVAVEGDTLIAVGPAHERPGLHGVVRIDVTDPADPRPEGIHRTEFPIHNAELADGRAYLTANGAPTGDGRTNELAVVDLSAGNVGRWSVLDEEPGWADVDRSLWTVHDVTVDGDRLYVAHWDAGTWVLDRSGGGAPSTLGSAGGVDPAGLAGLDAEAVDRRALELPGNSHYAAGDGDLLAVGREAWDVPDGDAGGPGGIDLYDADSRERLGGVDPPPTDDPTLGGTWTTAHNFEVRDDRLFASWYRGGVSVHDVSDPASPERVAAWRGDASCWAARRAPDAVVAASFRGFEGLLTFPVPTRPTAASQPGLGAPAALAALAALALGAARRA